MVACIFKTVELMMQCGAVDVEEKFTGDLK